MDTPHNREVIDKIKKAASRVTSRVDGPHAVMKIEAITLESLCMAKPVAENSAITGAIASGASESSNEEKP